MGDNEQYGLQGLARGPQTLRVVSWDRSHVGGSVVQYHAAMMTSFKLWQQNKQ